MKWKIKTLFTPLSFFPVGVFEKKKKKLEICLSFKIVLFRRLTVGNFIFYFFPLDMKREM